MVIGGSSKSKETKTQNKRSRLLNDNNTLPSSKHRRRVQPIYCHQCHQKDNGLTVTCKNQNGDKPCFLNFCGECLLRSYGDKAQEVALLDNWTCPRCRDICPCHRCRKKRGGKKTVARIVHSAKSAGFGLVSETTNRAKRKNPLALNEEIRVSPRTQRKKGTEFLNPMQVSDDEKIAKKPKMEGLEEVSSNNKDDGVFLVSDQVSEEGAKTDGERGLCVDSLDEIERAKPGSENEIEKDVEENQDEQKDADVETESPRPQGNVFRRNVLRFFRWFVGST